MAGEAASLVADLLGGDPVRAETATARLLVLGPRAVPHLLPALADADDEGAVRVLRVLELLPAGRHLVAPLDQASTRGAGQATAVAAVWASWLAAEDRALATLAFDRLATLALDDAAPRPARHLAVSAIRGLGDEAAAALLARVPAEVASSHPADAPPAASTGASANGSAHAADVRQHVSAHGATAPLSELHRLLEGARAAQHDAATAEQAHDWLATRGAVHHALALRGSTVALYDLRELLERLDGPPPVGAIAALRAVGDASCLEAMATAWARVDDQWTRAQLRAAAEDICHRHRLTGRHASLKRAAARAPALVEGLGTRRR